MQKHIYRVMILMFVFAGSLFYFGKRLDEHSEKVNTTMQMEEAQFPIITLKTGKNKVNVLHGYSSNIETGNIREAITPISEDKTFYVEIEENKKEVRKLQYEIVDVSSKIQALEGTITILEEKGNKKIAKINLEDDSKESVLEEGKEYACKITLTTTGSKKIHYYTAIKLQDNTNLEANIKFAKDFHDKALKKSKSNELAVFLETDYSLPQNDLSHVNIKSNLDLVSYGELKPEVVNEEIPTIKEINGDTVALQFKYTVKANTGSGEEYYDVLEYFRIRYTSTRIYLLNYDRTMEANFDINCMSLAKNELKLGITSDLKFDFLTDATGTKTSFVRNGDLWFYDSKKSEQITRVFSFKQNKDNYIREAYNDHNIRILNMEESGDIDFLVYGYMNRGDLEGRSCMVLYKYIEKDKRIEEKVYIPLSVSYKTLEEDLDSFSYLNKNDVFYFSVNEVVYSYNMQTKQLKEIASGISKEYFAMPRNSRFIAWQNSNIADKSNKVTIMDLETGYKKEILAKSDETIKILGSIDENFIYGYGKKADIIVGIDGNETVPLYQIEIADGMGRIEKKYKKKGVYITRCDVKDNIIELERKKKEEGSLKKIASDFILNKETKEITEERLTSRISKKAYLEYYLKLEDGIVLNEKPKVLVTSNTVITEDTTLQLTLDDYKYENYYVYALGEIINSNKEAGIAINEADENMGVVLNSRGQLIWERGTNKVRNAIIGLEIDNSTLDAIKDSKEKIDLTKATLEQVLYYVSNNNPVIGYKDKNHPVIITGYDEINVTMVNPSNGISETMRISNAKKIFEKAGNIFISHL